MIKLFTHTDLDGVGCAILGILAYGKDSIDIEYCNYDDINEKVEKYIAEEEYLNYTRCFITDISINEEVAKLIEQTHPKEYKDGFMLNEHFQLLDHHPTAKFLDKYWWCNVSIMNQSLNIKTSGTELFYEYLINMNDIESSETLEKFVNLVRNYDTWRWTELGEEGLICKQINDLYYIYEKDEFITWAISEILDQTFPRLYEKDSLILKIKQREIDEYIKNKNATMIKTYILNYKVGIVFADRFQSEMGNELCKLNNDIDFIAIIDLAKGSISYRTIKDIDLGKEIASIYGGGGHPKAAGSTIKDSIQERIIDLIF